MKISSICKKEIFHQWFFYQKYTKKWTRNCKIKRLNETVSGRSITSLVHFTFNSSLSDHEQTSLWEKFSYLCLLPFVIQAKWRLYRQYQTLLRIHHKKNHLCHRNSRTYIKKAFKRIPLEKRPTMKRSSSRRFLRFSPPFLWLWWLNKRHESSKT